MATRLSNIDKIKSFLKVTSSGIILYAGVSLYQGSEIFYDKIAMPLTHLIDPELAHKAAITTIKWGLAPVQKTEDSPSLAVNFLDLKLKNPIGMAAGFDKQGEAVEGLCKMGFSFVEIGSVTPKPQPGNDKPRVFRLLEDKAIINRYGFNSDGHEVVFERLKNLKQNLNFNGIVGVNLGKNKLSEDSINDYIKGLKKFCTLADYFVINISSPNTPGLRNLQDKKKLEELLTRLNEVRNHLERNPPLLLKLAPDLSEKERQDIAEVIQNSKSKIDGLVLTNTTVERNGLKSSLKDEIGGLSGAPLMKSSTKFIEDMYQRTHGTIPIIGVGGIFSGEDAYAKIKAGASLIQIYTSYTYHGPPIVQKIKRELKDIIEQEGHHSVGEVIGWGQKK